MHCIHQMGMPEQILKRSAFKAAMILSGFMLSCIWDKDPVMAQDALEVLRPDWMEFTDCRNSLYHFLEEQSVALLAERTCRIDEIQTLADWQKRQAEVKETLREIIGTFPHKTPLNAHITRTIIRDDYRVENIIYESVPGYFVTSSLFLPAVTSPGNTPAVIYCSGHTREAYRDSTYQHVILNMVRKGFIVFAFDPVGQGERLEYSDLKSGVPVFDDPTKEHSYAGAQVFLTGRSYARYMIWDGIRAVDYLLTRGEVDPERIGITGRSGGGTQSAYIAALDDRIHASAPECYITSFARLLQSIGPQDAEQVLYHGISSGIDHGDLLSVRAPKPQLLISTTNDYFSIQGARESAGEVHRIYQAYNRPNDFSMSEDIAGHASTIRNREAMYAFFQQHLDNPGSSEDLQVEYLSGEDLQVTVTGQVVTSFRAESVYSLNRRDADIMLQEQGRSGELSGSHSDNILRKARYLSGYRDPDTISEPVLTGIIRREGYTIEKYFITGESEYPVPYLIMVPDHANGAGVICLHPSGKAGIIAGDVEMEWMVKQGHTVLAPDLIGQGETGPGDFAGDSEIDGVSYNLWFASMLAGRSITGIQAADINRLAVLFKQHYSLREVFGVAFRETAPALLHAAAFHPVISRVALIDPLFSYKDIVFSRIYNPAHLYGLVPGALTGYDLPDLAAGLAPRKLLIAGITDAMGNPAMEENIGVDLQAVREGYKGSEDELMILPGDYGDKLKNILAAWLNSAH